MGKLLDSLNPRLIEFIQQQKMYFVATAGAEGTVNLSPKGMDSFRVLDNNRVRWLNLTGSGNETAAHVLENGRMTVMFCAFDGDPLILRLYGQARIIHPQEPLWMESLAQFSHVSGARQIFNLQIEKVQTSCGFAVPYFDYVQDRDLLTNWANKKGEQGLREYWQEKNSLSLDGKPTGI